MLSRAGNLLTALAAFALGGIMAWNYPLGKFAAPILFLATCMLAYYRPAWFLVIIPALLPIIGLAPWSGWITFEELDLLVLATASGGYTRALVDSKQSSSWNTSRLLFVLSALMGLSILLSMARGFSDAGGFVFGWFQGYDGPMNSIRIGKGFLWALLLVPLMGWLDRRNPQGTARLLALGLAAGCVTAALAALWERLAFTGLLNFSTDYRTTGLFWEMHVGGAALDGWLLLTIPFVVWAFHSARGVLERGLASLALAIAGYAALTTFSRGVFLGLLVSAIVLWWLLKARLNRHVDMRGSGWGGARQVLALALVAGLASAAFASAGYRGLLAMLGIVTLGLVAPALPGLLSRDRIALGVLLGLLAGVVLSVLSNFLPKGPYWIYGLLWLGAFLSLHPLLAKRPQRILYIGVIALVAAMVTATNIAGHWGGVEALPVYAFAAFSVLVVFILGAFAKRPLWPVDIHWQGRFLFQVAALSGLLAIFAGGAYMGNRFSTIDTDAQGRLAHWSNTIGLLVGTDDLLFGKGLGRFPANYYFAEPNGAVPGLYHIEQEGENRTLSLVGARNRDFLRLSQRVGFFERGPFAVDMLVKAKTDVAIHAEVCEKHLLYPSACIQGRASITASEGRWERLKISFPLKALPERSRSMPAFKTFSIGIGNQSGRAEIDDLRLLAIDGRNLLENSDFSSEMTHWFFTSDRDHMPWHAKNLLVNILFDQGLLGLGAFLLLTVVALWRIGQGARRNDELAPYWLAALLGFSVVGIFDSLTDVPRLAFVFYWVTLYLIIHRFGPPKTAQPEPT